MVDDGDERAALADQAGPVPGDAEVRVEPEAHVAAERALAFVKSKYQDSPQSCSSPGGWRPLVGGGRRRDRLAQAGQRHGATSG